MRLTMALAAAALLCAWVKQCDCKAVSEQSSGQIVVDLGGTEKTLEQHPQKSLSLTETGLAEEAEVFHPAIYQSEQESRKLKKKKPKLKLKKSKKFLKKFLPYLLIPLLIQAKLIPLFLFKLKLIALKAFGIGKLALLLIAINVIYNAMHGSQDGDQQYSQDVLASEHYGYSGGPEYGAWVNGR